MLKLSKKNITATLFKRGIMKIIIYAVEDDESIRDLYKYTFEPLGYECRTFETAEEMLTVLKTEPCHIILMDIMLPGMDGLTAMKQVREFNTSIPIIVVSARGDEINKVRGLNAGADDYLAKPFGVLELVARVKANVRKFTISNQTSAVYEYGEVKLNSNEHTVSVAGNLVVLTLKEFNLLKLLMQRVDNVVPRETILNEVWGYEYFGETRTLDMHIKSLRSKLAAYTDKEYIQTVRGVGYKFVVQ